MPTEVTLKITVRLKGPDRPIAAEDIDVTVEPAGSMSVNDIVMLLRAVPASKDLLGRKV